MQCHDAYWDRSPAVVGKTFPHSRRMSNLQFYLSGKRPMGYVKSRLFMWSLKKNTITYHMISFYCFHVRWGQFHYQVFCSKSDLMKIHPNYNKVIGTWSGVGCCFLLKLEYYSNENVLNIIFSKSLNSPALLWLEFYKNPEVYYNHGVISRKIVT